LQEDQVTIRDFSMSIEPKKFRVNDDIFEAAPQLPLSLLGMVPKFKSIAAEPEKSRDTLLEFFDEILLDGSAAKFRERVLSKTAPIGMPQMMNVITWLLEEYGLRPTEPSSDSSITWPGLAGMSSTDGASAAVSTP